MAWHLCWPRLPLSFVHTLPPCLLFLSRSLCDPEAFLPPMETSANAKKRPTFPSPMEEREKERDMGRNVSLECHYNG